MDKMFNKDEEIGCLQAIPFSIKIKRKKKVTTKRIASEAF